MRVGFAILLCSLGRLCAADLPAFPGAEGFGANTPGGRGGRVIAVTNLNDAGPGSFRAAVEASGPRIVIFRAGGIIDLLESIRVTNPYLTIAGQTAPGDGVCLRGYEFSVETHDVIVRYLRSRPGEGSGKEVDAMDFGHGARNVIFDHCSATWSVDECMSLSGDVQNVTMQWCLIAEGLNKSVHKKGAHGYGSLARANGPVSMHHNLWAHHTARNPRFGDNYGKGPTFPTFDFRNNVIYDYGGTASGLTQGVLQINYVANYIRPGQDSRARRPIGMGAPSDAQFYIRGNVWEGHEEIAQSDYCDTGRGTDIRIGMMSEPFAAPRVSMLSAKAAFELVLEEAGAVLPIRDTVDSRIVAQVRNRTGQIIDKTSQVGGWPAYRAGTAPKDTDGDGIPDEWERAHRLNPQNPADASKDSGDGYTWIERYINR